MAFVKSGKTQNEQLVAHLRGTKRELSAPQARSLFGIKNLRARMSELRHAGFRVRTSENKMGNTTYSIARRMIWQTV